MKKKKRKKRKKYNIKKNIQQEAIFQLDILPTPCTILILLILKYHIRWIPFFS